MPFAHFPTYLGRSMPVRSPREGAGVPVPCHAWTASASERRSARPPFATQLQQPLVDQRPGSRAIISRSRGMIRMRRSSAPSRS